MEAMGLTEEKLLPAEYRTLSAPQGEEEMPEDQMQDPSQQYASDDYDVENTPYETEEEMGMQPGMGLDQAAMEGQMQMPPMAMYGMEMGGYDMPFAQDGLSVPSWYSGNSSNEFYIPGPRELNADLFRRKYPNSALNKMTDRGQAASALKAADQQRKTRESLVKRKDDHVKNISAYTEQRIRSESEIKKLEAEVGPLRYIAELIYEVQSVDNLERSVRMVILLLVFVFDPLAIVLLIAANIGITNQKRFTKEQNIGILEIDDKVLDK
jgi:hypothetical protein